MLELHDLRAGYGQLQVLFDVSLEIRNGEAIALVGPNGAGKTTLVETIAGLVRTTAGTIRLDDDDITQLPAHERAKLGLSLVPTGRSLFGSLSVEKNLRLGLLLDETNPEGIERVFELFPVLGERLEQKAGTLSGGEQQMLAIARALLGRPEILILDEPSLGLAPVVTERMYAALGVLKDMGQTLLIVEEKLEFALDFAERYIVFNRGHIVREGATAELGDKMELSQSYLG
jgi:branched-chain amino acid transport system ATP-binding protein